MKEGKQKKEKKEKGLKHGKVMHMRMGRKEKSGICRETRRWERRIVRAHAFGQVS